MAAAWSRRVRRIGGFIQLAFAAFWLIRGGLSIGGTAGTALTGVALVIVLVVLVYAIRVTAGTGQRPTGPEAKRIERSVTVATVIELVASVAFPVIVIAAGHSDWVLPSIAITIGPLLLWLDHLVHIPRYRPVGWALTIGPFALVAAISGSALAATTGWPPVSCFSPRPPRDSATSEASGPRRDRQTPSDSARKPDDSSETVEPFSNTDDRNRAEAPGAHRRAPVCCCRRERSLRVCPAPSCLNR